MQRWCRLAVLFRRRVTEVARWPAWEVDLLDQYLAVQPAPDERIELAIAQLHATYAQFHRAPDRPAIKLETFMPYANPWKRLWEEQRYNQIDREFLAALG